MAFKKKADPSKTVTAEKPPGKVTVTTADEVSAALEKGVDVSDLNAPNFVRLPDDFVLPPEPSAYKFDPMTQGVGEPVAVAAESQAPVVPFTPYDANRWGPQFSQLLVDRSNELANKVWPNHTAYMNFSHGSADISSEERATVYNKNRAQFDRYPLSEDVRRIFGLEWLHGRSPNEHGPFTSAHNRAEEVIAKLKRLEKRHASDDIFDDETRDRIINTVLLPSTSFGVNDSYHGYNFLNLHWPQQRVVVNEVLTRDELTVIEMVINYIPRLRVLLANFELHVGRYTKEELMLPLVGRSEQSYGNLQEDKKVINTIKKASHFLSEVIPHRVVEDFIPELMYPRKSNERYAAVQKASKDLREACLGYILEQVPLSQLMQSIVDLSDELTSYFQMQVNELAAAYAYLDRVGVTFEKLVEDAKERIESSDLPWGY